MAVITGTVREVFNFCTPSGPYQSGDSPAQEVFGCFATFDLTSGDVYDQSADCTIDVGTAVAAARRDGKTYTLLGASVAQPGLNGTTVIGIGMPTSIASGTITAPITTNNLTTELGNGAVGAANRPVCVFCAFKAV